MVRLALVDHVPAGVEQGVDVGVGDPAAADRDLDPGDVADQPAGGEADEDLVDIGAGDALGLLDRLADRDLALLHVGDEAALDAAALALAGAEDLELAVLAGLGDQRADLGRADVERGDQIADLGLLGCGAPFKWSSPDRPGPARDRGRIRSGTRAPGSRDTRTTIRRLSRMSKRTKPRPSIWLCWSIRAKRVIARRAASSPSGRASTSPLWKRMSQRRPPTQVAPAICGLRCGAPVEQPVRGRRPGGWRPGRSAAADRACPRPAPARAPRRRRRSGSIAGCSARSPTGCALDDVDRPAYRAAAATPAPRGSSRTGSSRCAGAAQVDQRHRHRILIEGDIVDVERSRRGWRRWISTRRSGEAGAADALADGDAGELRQPEGEHRRDHHRARSCPPSAQLPSRRAKPARSRAIRAAPCFGLALRVLTPLRAARRAFGLAARRPAACDPRRHNAASTIRSTRVGIIDAARPRLLGHQAERRHAGLGVDLEQIEPGLALLVVPAEIGARRAPAAEQAVRLQRHGERRVANVVGNVGGADMLGHTLRYIWRHSRRSRISAASSVTASASSSSTATVSSRPWMKGSASSLSKCLPGPFDVAARSDRHNCRRRVTIATPTEEPSLTGFST